MSARTASQTSTPPPRGILLFIHGANETSEGLVANRSRIEDQVRARGWHDVRVVAPEWRRRSGLRLGDWRRSLYRGTRSAPAPIPKLGAGIRRELIAKLVTYYYEDKREALLDTLGAQLLSDVIGYQRHRASIQAVLREELLAAKAAAGDDPVLPVALSLGGIVLVDLLAGWPEAPVEACVTIGSQAPLLYTFDALESMPYDEADPPRLPV
ncbi:MAG TPA: hypothetical protein VD763_12155, partial [Candidatus Saccharimonadales bacterium]|nr:hypothetical protein [Candidatus Saccharimonadales bacterium]